MNPIRKEFERYFAEVKDPKVKSGLFPLFRLTYILIVCFLIVLIGFLIFIVVFIGLNGENAENNTNFQIGLGIFISLMLIFTIVVWIFTFRLVKVRKKALQSSKITCSDESNIVEPVSLGGENEIDEFSLLFPDPSLSQKARMVRKKQMRIFVCVQFLLILILLFLVIYFRAVLESGEGIAFVIFAVIVYEELTSLGFYLSEHLCLYKLLKYQLVRIGSEGKYIYTLKAQKLRAAKMRILGVRIVCGVAALTLSLVLALIFPSGYWAAFGLIPVVLGSAVMEIGRRKYRNKIDEFIKTVKSEKIPSSDCDSKNAENY